MTFREHHHNDVNVDGLERAGHDAVVSLQVQSERPGANTRFVWWLPLRPAVASTLWLVSPHSVLQKVTRRYQQSFSQVGAELSQKEVYEDRLLSGGLWVTGGTGDFCPKDMGRLRAVEGRP